MTRVFRQIASCVFLTISTFIAAKAAHAELNGFWVNTAMDNRHSFFIEFVEFDGAEARNGALILSPGRRACKVANLCQYVVDLRVFDLVDNGENFYLKNEQETGKFIASEAIYSQEIKPLFSVSEGTFRYETSTDTLMLYGHKFLSHFVKIDREKVLTLIGIMVANNMAVIDIFDCALGIELNERDVEKLSLQKVFQERLLAAEISEDANAINVLLAAYLSVLTTKYNDLQIADFPEWQPQVYQFFEEIGFDPSSNSPDFIDFNETMQNTLRQLEVCRGQN
jgi:hypothetical protein